MQNRCPLVSKWTRGDMLDENPSCHQHRPNYVVIRTQQKVYSTGKLIHNAVQHACQKADNGKITEMQSVTRNQLLQSLRSAPPRLVLHRVRAHL